MSIVCRNSSGQLIDRLYQWDVNYDVYISGVSLDNSPLCHFCNRNSKCAYVVAPTADNSTLKVTIPNALLAAPDTIFLYLYYNFPGSTARTVYVISFPVVPRQRPQSYAAVDNYLCVEMIDQAILEYITETAEQISDGLVARVTALENSTADISDELTDIREGYDGTTYQSAGEAVRAIGAAVAEIDPVPDVHPFASQTDYNNNIDPIYSGDFIVITTGSNGEKRLMFKQKDGTVTTLITTEGFYKMPVNGIPLTDLSDEVQALIAGDGDEDITLQDGYRTFGFINQAAYETFVESYPDAIQANDYIWINESTPIIKKYVLYRADPTNDGYTLAHVFTINNALCINVSIESNELVADTTLAQIRQALTQNRDLILVTENGVPIKLSDISYTGGVANEVQFTAVTYNGQCHILTTYIINGDGLTTQSQNLTLAGTQYIVIEKNENDEYEIVSGPPFISSMYELTLAAKSGVDVRLYIAESELGWYEVCHPLISWGTYGSPLFFGGIETSYDASGTHPVLAMYTIDQSNPYVTREEFAINNALVPSGGGSGGAKTTWNGTCSTAAATAAKTVSLSGYALEAGSIINITFDNAVGANATLNINSTGAISIFYHGAAINSGVIGAGNTALMYYDGSHYCLISTDNAYVKPNAGIPTSDLVDNTNAKWGFGYTTCSTAASTQAKTASLTGYKLVQDGMVAVRFTNAVGSGATLSINGQTAKSIYSAGSAITDGVITAGDTCIFSYDGTNYQLVSLIPSGATVLELTKSGTTVTLGMSFADAYTAFTSTRNTYLLLQIDTGIPLIMRPSKVNSVNSQISIEAVVGTTLYTATLSQVVGQAQMSGTLTQTSLGSSADQAFFVHIVWSGSAFSCVESFSDIYDAFDANIPVIPILDGEACGWLGYADSSEIIMYVVILSSNTRELYEFTLSSSNALTCTTQVLGNAIEPTVVTDSSASPSSLAAAANTIYKYTAAAVTALTISSFPGSGDFTVIFTSGSTATTLTLPQTLEDRMPSGFTVAANTRYEINVSDGWPLVASWDVSSS